MVEPMCRCGLPESSLVHHATANGHDHAPEGPRLTPDHSDEQAEHVADGTLVYLKAGMPGTYAGLSAVVRHNHPRTGESDLPRLVWLETEVIWSHGTADGFWAARAGYYLKETDDA